MSEKQTTNFSNLKKQTLQTFLVSKSKYFLMPYRFLQECRNSARFHWIPPEWNWNWPGFQWNSSIPAGMALEFSFFSLYKIIF